VSEEPTSLHEAIKGSIDRVKELARQHGEKLDDEQVISLKNSAEMIRRPHLWPHPNRLPLKKAGTFEVATLERATEGYLVLENLSLFGPVGTVTPHIFKDPEDIVLAGWIVD
jgi:hypothetical protein